MGVAKHLNFDMAWAQHVLFHKHGVVAETVDGFSLATGQSCCKVLAVLDQAHAFAAATGAGLDQHRVAHAVGLALQQGGVLVGTVIAGH